MAPAALQTPPAQSPDKQKGLSLRERMQVGACFWILPYSSTYFIGIALLTDMRITLECENSFGPGLFDFSGTFITPSDLAESVLASKSMQSTMPTAHITVLLVQSCL